MAARIGAGSGNLSTWLKNNLAYLVLADMVEAYSKEQPEGKEMNHINSDDEMFTKIMQTALDALCERIPREANLDRSAMSADIAEAGTGQSMAAVLVGGLLVGLGFCTVVVFPALPGSLGKIR